MMSIDPSLKSSREALTLMKKLEEKKKLMAEAESGYNRLCNKASKTNSELAGLKMERFKVESLIQELSVRVNDYEKREKELKEQEEQAKRSIKEANYRLAQELELRDSFNQRFSQKVIEMSTQYCLFKDSCIKSNVATGMHELKTSCASLTAEIEAKLQNLGLGSGESLEKEGDDVRSKVLQQVYQPTENPEYDTAGIRELQKLVETELDLIRAKNAEAATHVDRLKKRKTNLLEDIKSLRKAWKTDR